MNFVLKNSVTKAEYTFEVEDICDSSIFYHFNINLYENMDDGDYEYTLFDDNNEKVAVGLVRIGDYVAPTSSYTENNNETYVQYNG